MKYWIFQNNQVLGPYSPEDLGRLPSFSAESLVCPEGRKGTSMGDWQRAGMVPDLSIALIKASSTQGIKTPVAALAGLPPEPTLKDLAVLGSLQEKMAMLEDVVLQLQEGSRLKDAELAKLHLALEGKTQESSEIRKDAEQLRSEAEMRRREAEILKAETTEFKRRIADLEERASAVNRLTETIDKAVEAEKHVEHDVEVHGSTLAGLAHEIESLRSQMHGRLDSASASASVVSTAPAGLPTSSGGLPPEMPSTAKPSDAAATASSEHMPFNALPDIAPEPAFPINPPLPTLEATPAVPASDAPVETPSFEPIVATPAAPKSKKALILGLVIASAGLVGMASLLGYIPGATERKPAADIAAPVPAPVETPAAEPAPAPDERQVAIDFTKQWKLRSGLTLGQSLETLSPANGNLSPWMAEPLSSGRVQVNYFARGSSPGAPTVAYEFEVDLASKIVNGRNAAAKSVISEKAATPPAPKKAKPVKVKAKAKPTASPLPKAEESLDSLLGEPGAAPHPSVAPADTMTKNQPLPGFQPEASGKPSKPVHAKRAAKAASKAEKQDDAKAEDASLLDDLLKE